MTFFLGDLVVSVCGCYIDENAGPLLDPCVELSVGNKLHSMRLPVGACNSGGGGRGKDDGGKRSRRASSAVAFHGITEGDVLAVTVIDRSPPPSFPSSPAIAADDDHTPTATPPPRPPRPFIAEAEPLFCTRWGAGGRPARVTCRVAPPPPEEEEVAGKAHWGPGVGRSAAAEGEGGRGGSVSTVQLAICWSPAIRLRRPLSLVARAGRLTGRAISSKIDWPVGAAVNLTLGAADAATSLLLTVYRHPDPWWRASAVAASAVFLSLGSVVAAAVAAFCWPVVMAAAATMVVTAPAAVGLGWVLACTGPACEQLWRPLLVWTGTRWGFVRRFLLLPMEFDRGDEGAGVGADGGDCGDRGVLLRGQEACLDHGDGAQGWLLASSTPSQGQPAAEERLSQNALVPFDSADSNSGDDGGGGGAASVSRGGAGAADAGAVVLLLACYQNLIGVLHTGLEASRWRPRPR
eukprot:g13148.t1